ncbi:MAG: methyltransferase domain-containing protein [Chloroflexi bacterium]|nr:methyltransferase domain-containing protein [Chloroflexota bacterium]
MDDLQLLIDLHIGGERQGPGSNAMTRRAMELAGLPPQTHLRIADIGCGTGAASLILAQDLKADIVAIDFLPDFLAELEARAESAGVSRHIKTLAASMDALPFEDGAFDVIWSEGAIYNIGFETGLRSWHRYLKPGGVLAVSELTWLTRDRPEELTEHWTRAYSEVGLVSEKVAQIEASGYEVTGYFPLPKDCWLDHYYRPLQQRCPELLRQHGESEEARALIDAEQAEIALYERNADYVSYGFYIARKLPA